MHTTFGALILIFRYCLLVWVDFVQVRNFTEVLFGSSLQEMILEWGLISKIIFGITGSLEKKFLRNPKLMVLPFFPNPVCLSLPKLEGINYIFWVQNNYLKKYNTLLPPPFTSKPTTTSTNPSPCHHSQPCSPSHPNSQPTAQQSFSSSPPFSCPCHCCNHIALCYQLFVISSLIYRQPQANSSSTEWHLIALQSDSHAFRKTSSHPTAPS